MAEEAAPVPLTYFAKAQSEFSTTIPLVANENAYLGDIAFSDDADKTISSGFFRLEKGTPLVYSYWYDEMKIILEGEFHISDECGNSVIGKPGDVFKFPKGCKITFDTPTMGLAFFVGQRETGKL